ncbi:MAG: leucine-rich repeat domain-containing protein [Paraprevotella sp.]|nr:leucine-rich repeat domain-containing protein [Paraprevotella sp.]
MKKSVTLLLLLSLLACLVFVFSSCELGLPSLQGEKGETGRGILKTEIIDGYLWITYTDAPNTPVNVGKVVGDVVEPDGFLYRLNEDGKTVTIIGVQNCVDNNIIIPATFRGKPVVAIGDNVFEKCNFIKSVTISDGITSIGARAFLDCTALESVTIPASVKRIGDSAFNGCTNLTNITMAEGLESIGFAAFHDCTSLKNITLPESLKTIEESAFYGCTALTEIKIPHYVTTIEARTFEYCTNLSNVMIPNGVTSIKGFAFSDCSALISMTLPHTITEIGNSAFLACIRLENITFEGTKAQCKAIDFGYRWNASTPLTKITCTDGIHYTNTK